MHSGTLLLGKEMLRAVCRQPWAAEQLVDSSEEAAMHCSRSC